MGAIKSYRDLLVWQKAMLLVKQVYRVTQDFPRSEVYGLTSQMRRAGVSIPSNIAEGHGRHRTKEFIRFLRVSTGSLFELQTQLEIARDLEYVSKDSQASINSLTHELERMLATLIRKLEMRVKD